MKKCISYFFGTEIPAQPWYVSGKRCFRYKTKRPRSRRSEIEDLSVRKWDLNGICVDQVLAAKTNRKELVTQTWNAPLSPLKINVFLSQNLLGRKIYLFSLNLEENKQHPFSFCYKYHKSICKVDPRPLGIRSMEQIHPLLKHWWSDYKWWRYQLNMSWPNWQSKASYLPKTKSS